MKSGLELEYWTVGPDGELSSCLGIADEMKYAEPETSPRMIEIQTSPQKSFDDMRSEAVERIKTLVETAESHGKKIVPLGTPLNSGDIDLLSRSRRLEIKQAVVENDLEVSKRVAGTHMHFEKTDVARQFNLLTALDPAQALIASSPYYQGETLGKSSRNHAYRYMGHGAAPELSQLWDYARSEDELEDRIEDSFRDFQAKAREKGFPEEEVRKHYTRHDALWTPVRVRDTFPTVEWRAPDTSMPSRVLELARQVWNLMENPGTTADELPDFNRLEKLSRTAMEKGFESPDVREHLERMGLKVERFDDLTGKYRNGSQLSRDEARKLRLKAAEEMKEDISRL